MGRNPGSRNAVVGLSPSARDAPISFRVATDAPMTREFRRMVILANRGAEQIPGDMTYRAGYAADARKPAAPVRAEPGVDVARSVAARAAVERQHAALVNSGVVRFNISSPVGDAVAARGLRALKSDRIGFMGDPENDKPADPALAEVLIEALGPLAERAPLIDAARRKLLRYTVGGYVKMRTLDAALARSAAAASSVDLSTLRRLVARFAWRTYLEKREKDGVIMSYVDEQQFKVLCREVAAPRADEIWAEATAGLLLPFGLHHVSPEDGDFREFGDAALGDIAALELDSALVLACTALAALEQCDGDPVAVFSADFDARSHVLSQYYECGNRLYVSLAILDALALPREGERDGEAGAKRVGACAALLRDEHVRQAICRGDDSAIAQAIAYGRADVLDTLLSVEGVSLDPASWLGAPQPGIFMQLAAKNNSIDIIKLLSEHGFPAGVTPYEALDYAPPPQRAKLQEFVDARVALREPRREAGETPC
ncbi:hypothetical protein JL720_1194 [Aureococcus anophagefferens]|nr:hypothetical protein JL720_1194 [Aureococcus anophagefferens]